MSNELFNLRKKIREVLHEDFRFEYDANKYTPTPEMISTCKYAINAITKNKLVDKGGTEGNGLQKAQSIVSGEPMTHAQLKRMKAFFDNNQTVYNEEKARGNTIFTSGLIQKWNLWGGDAGKNWATQNIESHQSRNQKSKDIRPKGHTKLMDPSNTRTHTALSQIQNSR